MAVRSDEHERTLAFAEIALQQIRALRLPASPRNFEIWYQYATGYSPGLNRSINDTLAQKGTLQESDIERIYDAYLSPGRATDRLDSVGSRMAAEITQVLATIDAAAGSATSYSASLADASEELQGASDNLRRGGDGMALRAVIERLIAGAKEMEISNKKLEARLSASREEIEQLRQNLEIVRTESLTDPLTILRCRVRADGRRSQGRSRTARFADVRRRSLQGFQRSVWTPHRRPSPAPRCYFGEANRQG
jgi:diguanylate cyclase